ncbi:MAG: GntR family transcriptional regulator [Clostridiaceae bacterium]|nr:GntR family transcriptional regulator [Clostridiaceae bacterium]
MKEENPTVSRRQVFREDISNAIREEIFSGDLKPGDRIKETFWATKLGVSQGPVREAIRDLEGMGLVETVPFKGSRVRMLTRKDMDDNYSVRICLESKSIRDAISLLSDEKLQTLVKRLEEAVEKMDVAADYGDLRAFTECDARFHRAIIESTGNRVLLKFYNECNIRNWFMFSALTKRESLAELQKSHKKLLQAISVRNTERAVSLLEGHLTELMESYMDE